MKTPWIARGARPGQGDVLMMGSRFVLASPWRVAPFLAASFGVWRQALAAPGNAGVALDAQLGSRTFWTLSAWTGEDALHAFVAAEPHRTVMRRTRPWASEVTFRFWSVPAATLDSQGTMAPGLWSAARERIAGANAEIMRR
jgi:hypothetical protein